ncbi:MAG: hypothetical protein A2015_03030 [Spirochaetes bacterium GWF1_31_7]|nr:MAG: hypothetical protein A2Y30_16490 [Spirochaetes bacterium GWE1_32_154]OHD45318.1 MAG: hypothetical protein A2Y29_08310 [Spirochaetes bacterium GWE2_31_10]OHD50942.1 MAG: hypothetical protein A2015_03030 [Spirochaetes bacterium GWF1_31_7]OHD78385.1 MAG: hypothetical protein A2355_17230 [Spirochaetes bacterium RIFOXYB1_FULL_32_8]HBD94064.1 toxin HipA [Spirochaetia bacterium]
MALCLVCGSETGLSNLYHTKCSKYIFESDVSPLLEYSLDDMRELAKKIVSQSITVTGVQPKLSLEISKAFHEAPRLTLIGVNGNFILKPPSLIYPELPENEHLTMRLAVSLKINVVPHSLILLKSGEKAYITRRIDRIKQTKLHMEDMCQLTGRLTEDKYKGSIEQIGKVITQYCSNPGYDCIRLFESAVFSFITGNSDMHLKNYSLIRYSDGTISLTPFYDFLSSAIVLPDDTEESALNINGKKKKLTANDFYALAQSLQIPEKAAFNVISTMTGSLEKIQGIIGQSFLSDGMKEKYKARILRGIEVIS